MDGDQGISFLGWNRHLTFQQDTSSREMQQLRGNKGRELSHLNKKEMSRLQSQKVLAFPSMVTGVLPWRKAGAGVSLDNTVLRATLACSSTPSTFLGDSSIEIWLQTAATRLQQETASIYRVSAQFRAELTHD